MATTTGINICCVVADSTPRPRVSIRCEPGVPPEVLERYSALLARVPERFDSTTLTLRLFPGESVVTVIWRFGILREAVTCIVPGVMGPDDEGIRQAVCEQFDRLVADVLLDANVRAGKTW